MDKHHDALSYITNDWHLTGAAILQSGEPYSLYEFYGAVGSINFGNYPTLMNPILGIKDPQHPKSALTGNKGATRGPAGATFPPSILRRLPFITWRLAPMAFPVSTGNDPSDIYEPRST